MIKLETMPLSFRVWDKEKQDFVTLSEIMMPMKIKEERQNEYELGMRWIGRFIDIIYDMCNFDERYVISQDTGLKSKEKRRIFTGDILKHKDIVGVVEYANGYLGLRLAPHELPMTTWINFNDIRTEEYELIGNIWKNEELLDWSKYEN